ncbi:MAG: hypothetical protein WA081_19360 [Desulfosalsimonadaceae bacterium]
MPWVAKKNGAVFILSKTMLDESPGLRTQLGNDGLHDSFFNSSFIIAMTGFTLSTSTTIIANPLSLLLFFGRQRKVAKETWPCDAESSLTRWFPWRGQKLAL